MSAHFKAGVYVWLSALLEAMVRSYTAELREEVTSRGDQDDVLRCALGQCVKGEWQGIGRPDRRGLIKRANYSRGLWPRVSLSDWPESFTFADGRSVNADTFDAIWAVLELPGVPFESPAARGALVDVALRRNRLAHGEQTPQTEGRRVTHSEILRAIEHIDNVLTNLLVATDEWLDRQGWREPAAP